MAEIFQTFEQGTMEVNGMLMIQLFRLLQKSQQCIGISSIDPLLPITKPAAVQYCIH